MQANSLLAASAYPCSPLGIQRGPEHPGERFWVSWEHLREASGHHNTTEVTRAFFEPLLVAARVLARERGLSARRWTAPSTSGGEPWCGPLEQSPDARREISLPEIAREDAKRPGVCLELLDPDQVLAERRALAWAKRMAGTLHRRMTVADPLFAEAPEAGCASPSAA